MTECQSCGTTIDDYIVTVDVIEDRNLGNEIGTENIRKLNTNIFGLKSRYFNGGVGDDQFTTPLSLFFMNQMGRYYNMTGDLKRGITEGFDANKLGQLLTSFFVQFHNKFSKARLEKGQETYPEWYTNDYREIRPNAKILDLLVIEIIKVFQQNLEEVEMIINDFNSVRKVYNQLQNITTNGLNRMSYINKFCPNCGESISKSIGFSYHGGRGHNTQLFPAFARDSGQFPDWLNPKQIPGYMIHYREGPFFNLGDINDAIDNLNVAIQDNSTEYVESLNEIENRAEEIMAQILENYKVAKAKDEEKENEIQQLEERLSKLKGGS